MKVLDKILARKLKTDIDKTLAQMPRSQRKQAKKLYEMYLDGKALKIEDVDKGV